MLPRPTKPDTPREGQESCWDFPRPAEIQPVGWRPRDHDGASASASSGDVQGTLVRVVVNDVVIAESRRCYRAVETSHPPSYYIPPEDVNWDYIDADDASVGSVCEWKGSARYFDVRVGEKVFSKLAWSYPQPTDSFEAVKGYVAFYLRPNEGVRGYVEDEEAVPQAGKFYGGWITSKVVGPFKGPPGTSYW